jgi:ribosomal protein S18 acetylase RimI-like enzyme
MNDIIEITENNNYLLNEFLNNSIPGTFRYFNKRSINVIKNHIITLILIDDNLPVGYAHIDYDDNKYWFGVCILENYQGKGYGKKIMEYIFNDERIKNIDNIYLTVDKINYIAISLYKKYNFYIVEEKDTYFMMCLNKKYFL